MEEAKAVFDKQEDIEVDGHVLHITYKSPKLREKGEAKEMHCINFFILRALAISHIHDGMLLPKS